jgi:hypothetical protein
MDYEEFLKAKRHSQIDYGIKPVFMPDGIFDFQQCVAEKAIKKGRYGNFIDTGLGKTLIELVVAANYLRHTNKPVLIITPLAVAFQFIKEAEKFGIDDVSYSKDGKIKSKITICNYERLEHFNPSDFDCVILDESSILKNFEGAIKNQVTAFLKKVKYRYLFTATPSPNDYIELGTSSEALGYMGYMDMLAKFFKNNQNTSKITQVAMANVGAEWYLKPHAEAHFWQWIASWSLSMRKPSDLGFSDDRHILPDLHERQSVIINKNPYADANGQMPLMARRAETFSEIKKEVRSTINERCERAVILANDHETSVYWVNLNDEADLIIKLDPSAMEVKGKMNLDKKEEILMAFSNGDIKKLITKTSITAFGLNWQHCNHTTYFPTYSYEQYYQAIRRFWRFGQQREVFVDLILSDGQQKVMDSLMVKKEKAISMFENLTSQTNADFNISSKGFDKTVQLPSFLQ